MDIISNNKKITIKVPVRKYDKKTGNSIVIPVPFNVMSEEEQRERHRQALIAEKRRRDNKKRKEIIIGLVKPLAEALHDKTPEQFCHMLLACYDVTDSEYPEIIKPNVTSIQEFCEALEDRTSTVSFMEAIEIIGKAVGTINNWEA